MRKRLIPDGRLYSRQRKFVDTGEIVERIAGDEGLVQPISGYANHGRSAERSQRVETNEGAKPTRVDANGRVIGVELDSLEIPLHGCSKNELIGLGDDQLEGAWQTRLLLEVPDEFPAKVKWPRVRKRIWHL